jgi:predicted MFS family arabinose efflux permease
MAIIGGLALLPLALLSSVRRVLGEGRLSLRALAALRRVRAIVGYSLLMGFSSGLIMPFYSLFLKERYGAAPAQAGLVLSGINLATALAVLLGPLLSSYIGRVRGVAVTQFLATPFLLTAAYGPTLLTAALSLFARSAFTNVGRPLVSSVTMDIGPAAARASANDIQRTSIYLFRGLGSAAAGVLMQRGNIELPYPTYAVILAVSGVLFHRWFLPLDEQGIESPGRRKRE